MVKVKHASEICVLSSTWGKDKAARRKLRTPQPTLLLRSEDLRPYAEHHFGRRTPAAAIAASTGLISATIK